MVLKRPALGTRTSHVHCFPQDSTRMQHYTDGDPDRDTLYIWVCAEHYDALQARGWMDAIAMLRQLCSPLSQYRSSMRRTSIANAIRPKVTVRAMQPASRCRTRLSGNNSRWRLQPLRHRHREMRCPVGSLFTSRTSC